jgi:hypothetical protein
VYKSKKFAYLVNPNLGHPKFLNIDKELKKIDFQTSVLFVSNIETVEEVENYFRDKIRIVPVLDYRWKLKLIFEEQKAKKKGVLTKLIHFLRKKRKKLFELLEQKRYLRTEKSLRTLKARVFRGSPIIIIVSNIKPAKMTSINNMNYIEDEYCAPQDYLSKNDVFEELLIYYKATIQFQLNEEILEYFKIRNFIMFDIIYKISDTDERINYHSLVISKNEWQNFTFVHATDLHIAERNDDIYRLIQQWMNTFKFEHTDLIEQEYNKDFKNKKKEQHFPLFKLPLKKRFINPNNQFRIFIRLMNKKVFQNELDFIFLSGDLVDFTLLTKLPKDIEKFIDFGYDHSNWKIFKQILLNKSPIKKLGMIMEEELLCPIFTILGNHDYRPYHYDLRWAGMYRKIGLKLEEALALNDKMIAFPISAIIKSSRALRAYWSEINPLCDFFLKFGNNNFIFLNSGSDSFKNFRDLLSGHPSLTGLTGKQLEYLKLLTQYKIQKEKEDTFLIVHGPPINPRSKRSLIKRIQKQFGKKIFIKIDEFKESFLKKLGFDKPSKYRIDGRFNVKFGTIASHWDNLIEFCKEYCILTLAGHTHSLKEFRLVDPKEGKSRVFDAPPFSLKKIENPAAIYYDIYSEICSNAKDVEDLKPFVVQTPALGLGGYEDPEMAGAFREIIIKNGKLESFKVKYINR